MDVRGDRGRRVTGGRSQVELTNSGLTTKDGTSTLRLAWRSWRSISADDRRSRVEQHEWDERDMNACTRPVLFASCIPNPHLTNWMLPCIVHSISSGKSYNVSRLYRYTATRSDLDWHQVVIQQGLLIYQVPPPPQKTRARPAHIRRTIGLSLGLYIGGAMSVWTG